MRKFTFSSFNRSLLTLLFLSVSSASIAQYCTPTSAYDCSYSDDINSFSITGENNTSISDLNSGCSANGYADNTTSSVSLGQGATYTAHISSEYLDGSDGDYAAIWIDLNNNNAFESSELVGYLDAPVSLTSSNVDIVIPATTSLGNHRMRVTVYYPTNDDGTISSATVSPCNTGNTIYDYGETQDYTVNVVAPPLCSIPASLTASVTSNSATLNWLGTGNFIVEYGLSGFTPGVGATAGGGTIVTATTSTQIISNLSAQTSYDFYVRHDCSAAANGFSSNASLLGVLTTPANDLCTSAATLISASACTPTAGSTVGATTSGDNSFDCENYGNYGDVWYSFQANYTSHDVSIGNVGVTNPDQNDTYYGIVGYSGSCGTLTEMNCHSGELYGGNSGSFTLHLTGLTVGETYFLRFWKDAIFDENYNPVADGDVTFDICVKDPAPQPANDNCVNAINIPVTNGFGDQAVVATTVGSTTENSMTSPACAGDQSNDVWFTVTVPASGNVIVQSSASNDDEALDLVMEAYSGTCGALTLITCNDDGNPEDNSPSEYHPRISLTGQTPGDIIHIRMLPLNEDEYGPFDITAWDTTTLPPVTTVGTCAPAPSVTIDEATGNLYRWVPLFDASGNIIAELFANGNILGAVSASTYINTGAVRQNNGVYYLDRNVTITPANQPDSDVKVRIYILNQELSNLQAVDTAVDSLGNLNFSKNEDPCQSAVSGATSEYPQTYSSGYGANGAFVELNTSSFSSFFLRSGSTPLPILLTAISARNMGASNEIDWRTADETSGNYFELQRSGNGKNFLILDKIPGKGKASDYVYTDNNPLVGMNYYRLKMTDLDGTFTYSKIVTAAVSQKGNMTVEAYPNPTNKNIVLKVYGSENGDVTLTDLSGRTMYHTIMTGSELTVDMGSLVNGFYLLHYSDGKQNKVIRVNKQ